jgi:class 3 adenylate cyclase
MNAQISQKQDLVEQIKSFVPKEIFNRIIELHEKTRVSFAYAVDEVLRARAKHVVCLYSDIRGFTEGSRDPIFLRQLALPNIKKITKLVDSYRGVPRLVGDLVLAYFDFEEPTRNAELALKCAIEICKDSYGKVDTTSTELNRYILLTAGIAMVGNIGATDGSREITCLGSPMNLLQRIDEITKSQKLKNSVPPFSIIITADILTYIDSLDDLPFAFRELNLKELDISIRNFSEITKLYFITPSEVVHFKKAA